MNPVPQPSVRLIASPGAWIENEALRQFYALTRFQGVRQAVGFPDLHPGSSVPVGAAVVTAEVFHPELIGGDIGCGMALWKTSLEIREARPDDWADLRFDLEHPWEGDVQRWLQARRLPSTGFDEAMGALGEGNHFAELQAVEEVVDIDAFRALGLDRRKLALLVHSGSRGYGAAILAEHLAVHGPGPVCPGSVQGLAYLREHDQATRWAQANRELIAWRMLETLGATGQRVWDGCHNSIEPRAAGGRTLWVHRKGAVAADAGPVTIPGSRGSLSYVVRPCGDGASHGWSLAHGAGRRWSRSESRLRARERHRAADLLQTPLGGRVVCEQRDLLYEEAPLAYKSIESVIAGLVEAGLVEIVATLRPLLTYKTRAPRR